MKEVRIEFRVKGSKIDHSHSMTYRTIESMELAKSKFELWAKEVVLNEIEITSISEKESVYSANGYSTEKN